MLYLSKKFLHHFSGRFTHCYAVEHNKLFIDEEPTPLVTFKHDEADTLRFGDNIYIDIICSGTNVLLLTILFSVRYHIRLLLESCIKHWGEKYAMGSFRCMP